MQSGVDDGESKQGALEDLELDAEREAVAVELIICAADEIVAQIDRERIHGLCQLVADEQVESDTVDATPVDFFAECVADTASVAQVVHR